jgi:hypothetical protein
MHEYRRNFVSVIFVLVYIMITYDEWNQRYPNVDIPSYNNNNKSLTLCFIQSNKILPSEQAKNIIIKNFHADFTTGIMLLGYNIRLLVIHTLNIQY